MQADRRSDINDQTSNDTTNNHLSTWTKDGQHTSDHEREAAGVSGRHGGQDMT